MPTTAYLCVQNVDTCGQGKHPRIRGEKGIESAGGKDLGNAPAYAGKYRQELYSLFKGNTPAYAGKPCQPVPSSPKKSSTLKR